MKTRSIFFFISLFTFYFSLSSLAYAIDCDLNKPIPSDPEQLATYISSCQAKIEEKKGQALTLKAAIDTLNSKIKLTEAKIKQTTDQIVSLEKDITTLSTVVSDLDKSLNELTKVFLARVRESYVGRSIDPIQMLFSSDSFAKFFTRVRYLAIAKNKDQLVLGEMTSARVNIDSQKQSKINKQAEVEALKLKLVSQQADLAAQQRSKNDLLTQTRNDEKRYQTLLSQAREELEAINAIIAGNGNETEVRDVSSGEVIARLIEGRSCNSDGTHLHFIVAENTIVKNPFTYLKPVEYHNCSGVDGNRNCFDGDPFNPSGSWDWPLSPKIQLNQGYGSTWAVRNTWVGNIYKSHNGIDISGASLEVKSVQPGKLYRGSYSGSNGCSLKYVRVDHKDSQLESFYLHVNYY